MSSGSPGNTIFVKTPCLSEDQLIRYTRNEMNAREKHQSEIHLLDCELCSDAVAGFSLIKNREPLEDLKKNFSSSTESSGGSSRRIWLAAASVALLAGGSLIFYYSGMNKEALSEDKVLSMVEKPPVATEAPAAQDVPAASPAAVPDQTIVSDKLESSEKDNREPLAGGKTKWPADQHNTDPAFVPAPKVSVDKNKLRNSVQAIDQVNETAKEQPARVDPGIIVSGADQKAGTSGGQFSYNSLSNSSNISLQEKILVPELNIERKPEGAVSQKDAQAGRTITIKTADEVFSKTEMPAAAAPAEINTYKATKEGEIKNVRHEDLKTVDATGTGEVAAADIETVKKESKKRKSGKFRYSNNNDDADKSSTASRAPGKDRGIKSDSADMEISAKAAREEDDSKINLNTSPAYSDAAEALLTKGKYFYDLNQPDSAIAKFSAAIKKGDPAIIEEARWYLALSLLKKKDATEARKMLEDISRQKGKHEKDAEMKLEEIK